MPGFVMNWPALGAFILVLFLAALAGPHGGEKVRRAPPDRAGPAWRRGGRAVGLWADYYAALFGDVVARIRR
jgi:hypothetical protein